MYGVNPYMGNPYGNQMFGNQMVSQIPQMQTQVQQAQQTQQNIQLLKGRPVTSIEEARASMIDLDGSIFVFPDISNKRIYTKQIMLDGSAEIKSYSLEEPEQVTEEEKKETKSNKRYVLKSDYDKTLKVLNNQIKELTERLEGLGNESNEDV